jgi:hypothetical protein
MTSRFATRPLHTRAGVALLLLVVVPAMAMPPSDADTMAIVQGQVEQLGLARETAAGLLPPGVTVDAVRWEANVLHVDLTMPKGAAQLELTPISMKELAESVVEPLTEDDAFGGTVVRIRCDIEEGYRHLEDLVRYGQPATAAIEAEPLAAPTAFDEDQSVTVEGPLYRWGPTVIATSQPTGALSGVTVFCSAGHGWTAGASTWFLQRPVLLGMNEDYGNLDQLNYFVQYAYNAGATVVPFRPVGYQTHEIILDNDDVGVTFTGTWATNTTNAKYYENGVVVSGARYRSASSSETETQVARYTPTIPETGFYPVYAFAIASSNRTTQLYRIAHSGGVASMVIDHRNTGGGWVWLGEYHLEAGGDNWVEISNESAVSGAVIADAVRWGNGIGDIVRPGPDSISGYPREEECSKYWAQKELGERSVGYTAGDIWDSSSDDASDNVSTASRWSREMNVVPAGGVQSERWRRIYYEFHSNASGGAARGCVGLISASAPTTNQAAYATYVADEIDADMTLLQSEFEHTWVDRASATFTSEFGAISTNGNSNEFDATIIEVAFHDNQLDAELLRDSRVRAALARSSVKGIIRFLNSLPGSQVPLVFPPDRPRNFRVEDLGGGDVKLSWIAPLADSARGGAATGYVVYESTNGYGFGPVSTLGNVLTTTLSGLGVGETRYYRIAATNAGGQSVPTETLAVRRPATGIARNLVVNGFDRLQRQQNRLQPLPGGTIDRQQWRESNSYDYIIEHAQALADAGEGFASSSNEAVSDSQILLDNYDVVLWILGEESSFDRTFTATEQTRVINFLNNGGGIFITGAEVGFDLVAAGNGPTFFQNTLHATYVGDSAGTFNVTGAPGGILSGIGAFDFDPANGAPYVAGTPDRIGAGSGAAACLNYVGGTGGVAGIQYNGGAQRVVVFGFPFETITSATVRADIMDAAVTWLRQVSVPLPFDFNNDFDVDLADWQTFVFCFQGPTVNYGQGTFCRKGDGDEDTNVDLRDVVLFQRTFTGPN